MSKLTKKRAHWYEENENTGEVIADEDVDVLTSADAVTFDDGDTLQRKYDDNVLAKSSDVGLLKGLSTTNKSSLVDAVNEVNTSATNNAKSIETLNANMTDDIKTLKNTLGYTIQPSKNLLENTATSTEHNGVTFTVNDDGSVTANGKASTQASIAIKNVFNLPNGEYILSGCPTGGSSSTYRMTVNVGGTVGIDYGEGVNFTINNEVIFNVTIFISTGQTVDNLAFYPMIRKADVTDNTYEMYGGKDVDTRLKNTIVFGTKDMTSGTSILPSGVVYAMYE